MPGYRVKPVAKAVKEKLKYDLKDYCAMRGLSLSSFYTLLGATRKWRKS